MLRQKVTSSSIESIAYDGILKILEVEFKKGAIYQYFNVSSEVYSELINAKSVGSYFMKNIAKKYDYRKV
jgi:hypothetical protein